jgi:hypothetical protein
MSEGIWDQSYPPSLWAPPEPPPVVVPTGATSGTPGAWTPAGATAPTTLAQANALGLSLGAEWAEGSWVDLSTGADIYWAGTAFAAGQAPAPPAPPEEETQAAEKATRRKATTDDS